MQTMLHTLNKSKLPKYRLNFKAKFVDNFDRWLNNDLKI